MIKSTSDYTGTVIWLNATIYLNKTLNAWGILSLGVLRFEELIGDSFSTRFVFCKDNFCWILVQIAQQGARTFIRSHLSMPIEIAIGVV